MMSKRFYIFLLSCLVFNLFSGCKPNSSGNSGKPNIVVAHWPSEPATLNPALTSTGIGLFVLEYTQRTLTRIDMRTQKQIPLLVKSLAAVSADGLRYTYELRNDARWDDGSPLTVADIIFTVKMNKCPLTANEGIRSTYDNIKDIERDSANPSRFTMVAKQQYYLNPFEFDEMYLLQQKFHDPKKSFDAVSIPQLDLPGFDSTKYPGIAAVVCDFNAGPAGHEPGKLNGLGPYKLTAWEQGTSITLTRKDGWWGKNDTSVYSHAYPEKIIFRFIPDDAGLYLGIKKQELDVANFIGTPLFMKLRQSDTFNRDYFTAVNDQYTYNFLAMNMKPDKNRSPVFVDKNVRRAMAYLVPVDDVIKTISLGNGTRLASFVLPAARDYYNDSLPLIPFDPAKAAQLLDAAGWKDTDGDNVRDKMINGRKVRFSFHLTYGASPSNKEVVLMYRDAMAKAGIDLIPDPVDASQFPQRLQNHDFDMISSSWSTVSIPDDPEQIFGSANWANHGFNFTGFGNAESDRLIAESNKEIDPAKRAALLKKLQAIVYDEQPYIFTYSVKRKSIISRRFNNLNTYSIRPGIMLNNLQLKQEPE